MKKIIALFILAMSIVACGQFQSSQQLATQTAAASTATSVASIAEALAQAATEAAWTPTSTSTPAIDYSAKVIVFMAELYAGPGETYSSALLTTDKVTIIGQAYQCAWFKVVSNVDSNMTGWISAKELNYTVQCSDVQEATYPPAPLPTSTDTPVPPTNTPLPPPTATSAPKAPSAPSVSCLVNSNIIIQNRSGAPFTIYLSGPGSFAFSIGASDTSTVKVCSGSYNYTINGTCHGAPASGSGRISDGDQVYFYCN
jgi:hypothetical protein